CGMLRRARQCSLRIGWLSLLLFSLAANAAQPFVPGRILVKSRAGVTEEILNRKLQPFGAQARSLRSGRINVVSVSEHRASAILASLNNDPDIEFAERDFIARTAFVP